VACVGARRRRQFQGVRPAVAATIALLAIGLCACGGKSHRPVASGPRPVYGAIPRLPLKPGENPARQVLAGAAKKRGGTLTVYSSAAFHHLDPGSSYSSLDYGVDAVTQRPLFSYLPNNQARLTPDLATAIPTIANHEITDGGKTITIHIRPGVYFSPPVNREVTSADVAYAIERAATPSVDNPYFSSYFGAASLSPLLGAGSPGYRGGPIPGIQTPSRFTIVFHTSKPSGSSLISALSLPLSAPVPRSFAAAVDTRSPTAYGTRYLVATGPYMIESDLDTGLFAGIGYRPGKSLTLVRNPNWNPRADFRPAYLDRIEFKLGGDARTIGEQVLKGSDAVEFDPPAPSTVTLAYDRYPSQITFTAGAGEHYVAFDTRRGPFANLDLRRAVYANLDRAAAAWLRGGSLVATAATHFIYPGLPGFEQSGGDVGPLTPWNQNVNGDLAVAETYLKAAGYRSGRYTGGATVQIVGDGTGADAKIVELVNSDLTQLGFDTRVDLVNPSVVSGVACGTPAQAVDVCAAVGRIRDFADPLTVLYRSFHGQAIGSNAGQVDSAQLTAAMKAATQIPDSAARAQAWANVDKMLVYLAVAIPEDFDSQPDIESRDVAGVNDQWNQGTWDLAFTSLDRP
jgi:peptide/nickel transport system substrate-binding protein